jgi:hypothetical protein
MGGIASSNTVQVVLISLDHSTQMRPAVGWTATYDSDQGEFHRYDDGASHPFIRPQKADSRRLC